LVVAGIVAVGLAVGTGVLVAGTGVFVAGTGVAVAGTGVLVAGTGVLVALAGVVAAAVAVRTIIAVAVRPALLLALIVPLALAVMVAAWLVAGTSGVAVAGIGVTVGKFGLGVRVGNGVGFTAWGEGVATMVSCGRVLVGIGEFRIAWGVPFPWVEALLELIIITISTTRKSNIMAGIKIMTALEALDWRCHQFSGR
jgi:hypothetical protein